MQKPVLDLADLVPQSSTFTLSTRTGETFTLRRWSVLMKKQVLSKFSSTEIERAFSQSDIVTVAEIAWIMLDGESKARFTKPGMVNEDVFLESIATIKDQLDLTLAISKSIGVGEPEIKKIVKGIEKQKEDEKKENAENPNEVSLNQE